MGQTSTPCALSTSAHDKDAGGALVTHWEGTVEGADKGSLHGLTFVAKDNLAVKGVRTGAGNPTWLSTHPLPEEASNPAVQALLTAGATLVGKAEMDELAFSLNGQNVHYGTPLNAADAARIPGGSSSGSCTAVAVGFCDFSLGTDTAGSVRVPASYQGLYGIRTTHGRCSLEGCVPLAPSFDSLGWFARDAKLMCQIGDVLLADTSPNPRHFKRCIVGTDAFALANESTREALLGLISRDDNNSSIHALLCDLSGSPEDVQLAPGGMQGWKEVFRVLQMADIWHALGGWITENEPKFGADVDGRFKMSKEIDRNTTKVNECKQTKSAIVERMINLLAMDAEGADSPAVLLVPTTPAPAPLIDTPANELDDFRQRAFSLTCMASLAGLPQVNIPAATVDGAPVGLGLIGPRGTDEHLLALAVELSAAM
eukprot:CAMPEP_0197862430 /NCGR_PEP_ID=MMETSP1438-20131217/39197_1 /TAXON_ID=1461541 /ORGANISM="Pterosperma sp., Strain CCMP1384" /LENGTH=427 /DNA_ID=CAMNT_0043479987 /DNA_START=393 /DNA_END=1676 /DNA_ORIENTATION=+